MYQKKLLLGLTGNIRSKTTPDIRGPYENCVSQGVPLKIHSQKVIWNLYNPRKIQFPDLSPKDIFSHNYNSYK